METSRRTQGARGNAPANRHAGEPGGNRSQTTGRSLYHHRLWTGVARSTNRPLVDSVHGKSTKRPYSTDARTRHRQRRREGSLLYQRRAGDRNSAQHHPRFAPEKITIGSIGACLIQRQRALSRERPFIILLDLTSSPRWNERTQLPISQSHPPI